MNCLTCGYKNPATVSYCQKCGARMDLTADEIRNSLVEKARDEVLRNTEFYARQSVVFAAVLLLLALTLIVLAGGAPAETYHIPSASNGAKHVGVSYDLEVKMKKLMIPLAPRKK